MDNRRNYYRTLRVQPDASHKVIQQSYRALMQNLRLHPDLGGDHWDASIINQAYATLRDAKKRAAYDVRLLEQYNIITLSRGGMSVDNIKILDESDASSQTDNNRNYYRVLHVQPDAEIEVICASYRTLCTLHVSKNKHLINSAFRVIGNVQLRAQYDALLKSHTHASCVRKLEDAERLAKQLDDNTLPVVSKEHNRDLSISPEKPLEAKSHIRIRHYCKFCKTPYFNGGIIALDNVCVECDSPLSSPTDIALNKLGRSLDRMQQTKSANIYEYWPGQPIQASLEDLSPAGLSFSSLRPFDTKQIIKVNASHFNAVAEVAYCITINSMNSVGAQFLTIKFLHTTGSFVSTYA